MYVFAIQLVLKCPVVQPQYLLIHHMQHHASLFKRLDSARAVLLVACLSSPRCQDVEPHVQCMVGGALRQVLLHKGFWSQAPCQQRIP